MTDPLRVAVVGGSLGGLTAALLLRDLGYAVDVYERSTAELQARGAGIVVLDETSRYLRERTDVNLADVTIGTSGLRYLDATGVVVFDEPRPYRYSGWHTIYRALLDRFGPEHYRLGREVTGFVGDGTRWSSPSSRGPPAFCDLLVCADGIASSSRSFLLPDTRPAYAGYVAWRGTVAEERLSPDALEVFADALVYEVLPQSHILLYPIPERARIDPAGTTRLLNFVWYRNYAAGEALEGSDDGLHRCPPRDHAAAGHRAKRARRGDANRSRMRTSRRRSRRWSSPPVSRSCRSIVDIEVPQMAFGRVCLIGDAAFALRPHIAAGTAKAAADAWALAEALEATGGDVAGALPTWETRQLAVGRAALERARRNGDRSQFDGTWDASRSRARLRPRLSR